MKEKELKQPKASKPKRRPMSGMEAQARIELKDIPIPPEVAKNMKFVDEALAEQREGRKNVSDD